MNLPQRILITGASGAIGGALALEYAKQGNTLLLQGRRADRLIHLASQCEAKGARVETYLLDVRDYDGLATWVSAVCTTGVPDLVIVNAGLNANIGPEKMGETWLESRAVIEVNLLSAMAITQAILPAMRARKSGQIALIGSLAGWFGLPVTPAYCASKSGLKAYGESLRGWLSVEGIRVNVIMPGFVRSPMCDDMPGPKPFLWSPERAARSIARGLARDKARISFPFPLNWGAWWLAVLPASLSHRIVRWLGYGNKHA